MNGTEFTRITGSYSNAYIGTWSLLGQSIRYNESYIRLYGYFYFPGTSSNGTGSSGTWDGFYMDGIYIASGAYRYYHGYTELGYVDITVKHNADGVFPGRSVGIYAHSYHFNKVSATGTIPYGAVPNIPRASKPSCITYPNNTEDVGKVGTTFKIHMNRKSTSLFHVVKYSWFGKTGTIATNVADNCDWTTPEAFNEDIQDTGVGEGNIEVDTYFRDSDGDHYIGTETCKFRCTVSDYYVRIKVDGIWKKGVPYIKVNGAWKKGTPYVKVNGTWQKGV